MKPGVFCIFFFLILLHSHSVESARGGGGRFGGGRFSSSRYSSSFRYSSSRYSSSYRSYRSYRSYYRRYSIRNSYRSSYSSIYRSSMKVSAAGMGGITTNKQALLLAGSVYVSYRVRPRVFISSGTLYTGAADEYAICAGLVRCSSFSNKCNYAYDEADWNVTSSSPATTTAPLDDYKNSTVGVTTSQVQHFVTYNYFLCPSDLFANKYDEEDGFCCGPVGSQMCCSKDDFDELMADASTMGLTIGVLFGVGFAAIAIGCPIYILRSKIRACLSCRNCRRSNSGQSAAARTDVTFHRVAKADEEPQVILNRRLSSSSNDRNGGPSSFAAAVNPTTEPFASGVVQPQYPLYPPQVSGSSGNGVEQQQHPLYPPQVGGDVSREPLPQYSLYPPQAAVNGDGDQQMPPLPSHPPPAYEDVRY